MSSRDPIANGSILKGRHDRYRVGAALGQGGIGEVWAATAVTSGAKVAVKALSPHRFRLTDAVFERFLREIEHGSTLDHPNLVKTIDRDDKERPEFLVMELVEGRTLSTLLSSLTRAARIDIAKGILDALQHLHSNGVAIQPGPKLIVELETAPFRGRWLLPEKGVLGERET